MTLAGGDFRQLTLEEFLNCGYMLLVDEMVRLGERVDLMTAQEQLGLIPKSTPTAQAVAAPPKDVVASENDDAMRALQQMMKGTGR